MLTGASANELDMLAPMSEKELTAIFPRSSATVMRDPLTTADKTRIHDNIRRDPASAVAPFIFTYFLLGPDSSITLGLNRQYANEERKKNAFDAIQTNERYLDIIEDIMNRDENLEVQTRKMQLVFQGSCFGRSVMIKQYDKNNLPIRYIPLSPTRLGRVYVDTHSHEFLGVEYLEYPTDRRILLAKDVIHYECNDMMITPRARYYGMAMAEPLMAVGERNRVMNEIAIPEITRKNWSSNRVIKVNTGSQQKLNQIKNAFALPGKDVVINDQVEVTNVPLNHDLEKIQVALENGNKDIFRTWTVPQGIGWPEDPNHATMENSLLAWYNGILSFRRAQLDSVMWLQHYKPQLKQILADQNLFANIPTDPNQMVDYMVQKAEQPLTPGQITSEDLPFRIVTEFKNIKTVGFLDNSAALLGWYNANIINREIALKEGGMEQYIDDMAEEDQNQVSLGNNLLQQDQNMMMNMQMQQQQQQQQSPTEQQGQGIAGVGDIGNRPLSTKI